MKLHLGCGSVLLKEWVNIDLYNKHADIKGDVAFLPNYKDNSVDCIYTSHLIEHLMPKDFQKALLRWYKILKFGGNLVIRCPDIDSWLRVWLESSDKDRFDKPCLRDSVIGMRKNGYRNNNLFSKGLLIKYLEDASFKVIECRLVSSRSPYLWDILINGGIDEGKDYTGYTARDIWCYAIKEE